MGDIYIKENQAVLLDNCGRFIYEVFVFVKYKNIFSTVNHRYFSSETEIKNIISSYQYNEFIEIYCELYSAPLKWLLDNEFVVYVKPEKKKRNYKKR